MRAIIERWELNAADPALRSTLRDLAQVDLAIQIKATELEVVRGRANGKRAARRLERDLSSLRRARVGLEKHISTFASRWTRRRIEGDNREALRRAEAAGGIR
jgi:hypothetical protein